MNASFDKIPLDTDPPDFFVFRLRFAASDHVQLSLETTGGRLLTVFKPTVEELLAVAAQANAAAVAMLKAQPRGPNEVSMEKGDDDDYVHRRPAPLPRREGRVPAEGTG